MKYTAGNIARTAAIALAVVVLGSCSDDLDFGFSNRPSDYISFYVGDDSISSTGMTRGTTTHLVFEDEEWSVSDEGAATRATPITTLANAGTVCVTAFKDAESSAMTELANEEFSFDQDLLEPTGSPVPWSKAGSEKTTFYAYAPKDFIGTYATLGATGTQITYTVPADVAEQKDLLTAKKEVLAANYRQSVPLDFTHALTAVRFKVGFACNVKSISIQGVHNQGTYTIGGDWSGQSGTDTYTFTFDDGSGYKSFAEDAYLTTDDQTLLLIPQTLPEGAKIELTKSDDTIIEANIKDNIWEPGHRITYIIYEDEPNYIYFDLAADKVTIINGAYNGKVYSTGGGGPVEVSGTHEAGNKYYVYQSSPINRSDIVWTGTPGKSKVSGLPTYDELKTGDEGNTWSSSGEKTWSEFITNNSDVDAVIEAWPSYAVARGMQSTPNTIKISGNMEVDITIDNTWSTYHETIAHRTTGGFLIGPGTPDQGGKAPSNNRYERVTLNLKGDNHYHNILYYGHPSSQTGTANCAYFHITSYDGDGSSNGSMTVTVPDKDYIMRGATTILGGGDDDDTPPCNDMSFLGGTIYAGTSKSVIDGDAVGLIGGGSNNSCNLFFEGATVTAVGYSNGAAIGGGGGYQSYGGNGTVTINDGFVYAYQFGTTSAGFLSSGFALATAAIGGGSSYRNAGNDAYITINGGEVYAQSIGGVAIGGGSSGTIRGGNATVNITGGHITAKSIPGYIAGITSYSESKCGSAIGGGTGGYSDSGIGGNATLTISGGTLNAGSVGGGGTISSTATIGSANINISGSPIVQGQFIMAAGAETPPTFTMNGGTINNSKLKPEYGYYKVKDNGGAVYMEDGTCTISGGTIKNASATKGGAVYIERKTSTASFTMSGSAKILNCTSTENGGAIYLEGGDVTINDGKIDGNLTSGSDGGAIYINKGSFSMTDGEISNNHSATRGGGVFITSDDAPPTVTVTGGSIHHNTCDTYGGGICVYPSSGVASNVTIGTLGDDTTPDVYDNTAKGAGGGLYANGEKAVITINGGRFHDNYVTPYTPNQDVANEGGTVTLNGGEVTSVNVTYNASGGMFTTGFGTTVRIVKDTNSTLTLPTSANVERSPYTLAGWTDVEGSSTPKYSPGQKVLMNISSDVTLYAVWQ